MTTPAVPDLAARILEAIAHVEALTNAAAKDTEPEWSPGHEYGGEHVHTAEYGSAVACGPYGYMGWELRQHIALNDPKTILLRCAADRRTVERHQREVEPNVFFDILPNGQEDRRDIAYCAPCTLGVGCDHCISWNGQSAISDAPALWPCDTIRDLAEVYGVPVVVAEEGQPT